MLLLLCVFLLLLACVPFFASHCPWMVANPHASLAGVSFFIVVLGLVAVVTARGNVEAVAKSAKDPKDAKDPKATKCAVCGSDAGVVLCLGCGSLQPSARELSPARPLRMA